MTEPKTVASQAAKRSITKNKKNEIFVDILEKINVVFDGPSVIQNLEELMNFSVGKSVERRSNWMHSNEELLDWKSNS